MRIDGGRVFLNEAKAVLARVKAADAALAELTAVRHGTLSVQASQTIARYWLPRQLAAFRRRFSGIEIRLGISNTAAVAKAVGAGGLSLAAIPGAKLEPGGVRPGSGLAEAHRRADGILAARWLLEPVADSRAMSAA